jgi:copper chaperone CopZ
VGAARLDIPPSGIEDRPPEVAPVQETTYTVPGIHCAHCSETIANEIGKVTGVTGVDVDLDAKLVAVRGSSVDDGSVRRAIADAGYEAVA